MTTTIVTTSRVPAIAVDTDTSAGMLTLQFSDKTKATVRIADFSEAIILQATLHGLKQKLVDAAAIARDTTTGRSASDAVKKEAVLAVLERLQSGEWNKTRETGEGGGKGNLLSLALQRLQPGKTPEAVAEWLAARTEAERVSLRKNASVLRVVAEIKAERAAKAAETAGVDGDGLLAEFLSDDFGGTESTVEGSEEE